MNDMSFYDCMSGRLFEAEPVYVLKCLKEAIDKDFSYNELYEKFGLLQMRHFENITVPKSIHVSLRLIEGFDIILHTIES